MEDGKGLAFHRIVGVFFYDPEIEMVVQIFTNCSLLLPLSFGSFSLSVSLTHPLDSMTSMTPRLKTRIANTLRSTAKNILWISQTRQVKKSTVVIGTTNL